MAQLIYEADLAIGAAGSSVWERCCLGLPQVLMLTADNQKIILENLKNKTNVIYTGLQKAILSFESVNYESIFQIINRVKFTELLTYVD